MLRTLTGRVINNKMMKTVVVEVESSFVHPLYKKKIRTRKKYKAHDDKGVSQPGDVVKLVETRPISKEKRWKVSEVITRKGIVEKPVELEIKEVKEAQEAKEVKSEV